MARTFAVKSATVNPSGATARASTAASAAADAGLVDVDAADAGGADLGAGRQLVEYAVGQEADVDAVEHGGEPVDHAGQPADDVGELLQHPAGVQSPGVVHDRLEAQYVFALGVALQRQESEVDLEQGEVPPRSLDHDCLSRRQVPTTVAGALADPEEGAQPRHVQPGTGPVHNGVEGALHRRAGGEDQVAAVLDLKDRVGVAKAAAVLLVQVEPEAQARGVDPRANDLAQAPYRPGWDKVSAT